MMKGRDLRLPGVISRTAKLSPPPSPFRTQDATWATPAISQPCPSRRFWVTGQPGHAIPTEDMAP